MTTHDDSGFIFWEPFLRESALVILTPFLQKYRGGLSPRDTIAMAEVVGALTRLCRDIPEVKITDRLLEGDDRKRNLLLIGSASGNVVVEEFLKQLEIAGNPLSFSLASGYWQDTSSEMNLVATPVDQGAQRSESDFGIVARAPNPFESTKIVTFVSGIHGYGTLAAAKVFASRDRQEEIKELLNKEQVGFDAGSEPDAVVEVILKTDIDRDSDQVVRSLKDVKVQFVRVDRDLHRQWPASPAPDVWTREIPEPRPERHHHRFSVVFDHVKQRALVKLQGQFNYTHFVKLAFKSSECDVFSATFDRALSAASTSSKKSRLRKVGDKLQSKLEPAMKFAPGVGGPRRPEDFIYTFGGPASYLQIPFETTRMANNEYLELVHPVIRSITDLTCERPPLSHGVVEELSQKREKLQLLLAISNPRGDLRAASSEGGRVIECLKAHDSWIEPVLLENPTVAEFTTQLRARRYHMLHYVGHSYRSQDPARSCLILQDEGGNPKPLFLDEFSHLLKDKLSPLSFCYMSSCESAATGDSFDSYQYDFLGFADSLVRAGIPSVLGFRNRVEDRLARDFASHFYRNLFQPWRDFSLPRALLCARKELYRDWPVESFTPILVMQD